MHRELQAVDPDALSDAELVAYLTRCRDHHSAMIAQHMRFTAGAVIPTGDFLAHVGDWTGLPPSELLGLMRGSAVVSAGGSDEMERLKGVRPGPRGPQAARIRRRRPRTGAREPAFPRWRSRRGGLRLPRPGRQPPHRRLRHRRALGARIAGRAAQGHPHRRSRGNLRPPRTSMPALPKSAPRSPRRTRSRVRRTARRGPPHLPPPRRAWRLQRHLGLGPDAARRPCGWPAGRESRPHRHPAADAGRQPG